MEIDIKGGYRIKSLSIDDIDDVDDLNKRCTDFYMLHDGIMPAKDDAVEIFTSLPPGNTYDDKYVLGIYNMA
jgi:hypothetical protein